MGARVSLVRYKSLPEFYAASLCWRAGARLFFGENPLLTGNTYLFESA